MTESSWHGFEGMGRKVPGGWEYQCDGMPSLRGCGQSITIPRQYARVGVKASGWLVCYGLEPNFPEAHFDSSEDWHEDHDVVLTFCPDCRATMEARDAGAHEGRR